MPDPTSAKQYAPAADRNREPILAVLQRVLPRTGCILEIASGTGQHATFFAPRLAPRLWQPSDPDPQARDSIQAWRAAAPADNLLAPVDLDAAQPPWPIADLGLGVPITAIVNINMIHISPWDCCLGLMAGASQTLPAAGLLFLYGPFKQGGQHSAPSNAAFDQHLRSQNPAWGVRDLEAVTAVAAAQGLDLQELVSMPANNLSVVFRRAG